MPDKLNCAILGTGNIGADLLVKVLWSDLLECTLFAGRNLGSERMKKGINVALARGSS
jgi:acetaldehyde dehydrogenase (acetylating)